MPLIHSKRPAAFKHNIETEMEHGKPQKQAVAIAYHVAYKKAKGGQVKCAHGGPMHCDMGCYAKGGDVSWKDDQWLMGRSPSEVEEEPQDINPGFSKDPLEMGRKGGPYSEHWKKEGDDLEMDPEIMAEGGEAGDGDGAKEIREAICGELMDALKHDDKHAFGEALEAFVMECMNKGDMDV